MPRYPKLLSQESKQQSLGMPRVASPLSSNDHRYFTWNYIFIRHIIWVFLGASCMIWVFAYFILCFKSWSLAGHTYFREPKLCHDLLELLSMLHLNFYELWICSSASLISFWARYALVFLKKSSHASLIFIWDLVILLRNSLLIHLDYFERKKFFYAHDLHLYLFEPIKSNIWK